LLLLQSGFILQTNRLLPLFIFGPPFSFLEKHLIFESIWVGNF
jgi:hypothetical protein